MYCGGGKIGVEFVNVLCCYSIYIKDEAVNLSTYRYKEWRESMVIVTIQLGIDCDTTLLVKERGLNLFCFL